MGLFKKKPKREKIKIELESVDKLKDNFIDQLSEADEWDYDPDEIEELDLLNRPLWKYEAMDGRPDFENVSGRIQVSLYGDIIGYIPDAKRDLFDQNAQYVKKADLKIMAGPYKIITRKKDVYHIEVKDSPFRAFISL
jgi:hypothetical protein